MAAREIEAGAARLYQDLVETSQDLIWQCDAEGRYVYLNPAWEETLGYEVEEMLGRRFADFQTSEQARRDLALFARLLEGATVKGHETVHLHKLGHPVQLRFSAKAHFDAEGRIAGTRGTAHDVTAAKALEAELRRSQESYRRMFEDMPLAFCTAGVDLRFRETNPAFERLFGYSAEELRALTFRDLTLPEQVSRDGAAIAQLVRGELPVYRTTKRYRTKSGRLLWGLLTVSGVRDEHGKVRHCLAGVEDITEIKEAEGLLAEAQRIGEMGSYDFDVQAGRWTSSPKLDEIFGIDDAYPRDVSGWLALVHPEERELMGSYLSDQVLGQGRAFDREYRLARRRDGAEIWVHGRGVVTCDDARRPIRMRGTIQDITASKRAQSALRASEQKYRTLVDQLNVGVFHTSLDGRFLHANLATARTAGFDTVEELREGNATRLYAREEERRELIEALQRDGAVHGREVTSVRRDGCTFPLEVSAVLLRDTQGRPESILGVVADVSERKRTEELARRSQRLEALGLLAGGIAHDFNNLLTGVFGFIELAQQSAREPELQELLRCAGEPLARARSLTLQLLTFAKGGQPARRVAPLAGVVESAVRFALAGTRVKAELALAEDLRLCNYDEHQLAQVLGNLFINAVQAMPHGGTLTVRAANVQVAGHLTLADGDYVRISVQDQGVGIPREILPRIFDPYFTTKQTGSGLGLATAYSIARRHEGAIEVESAPGQGSTFHLFLPAAEAGAIAEASPAPVALRGEGTVLVMDDEGAVRAVLERMLERLGYRCLSASDGDQLLGLDREELAAGRTPVCAILDLTIAGGEGGIEIKDRLRALGAELPIFAASGYSDDPVIAEPARFDFQGSLAKPFTLASLSQLLAVLPPQRR